MLSYLNDVAYAEALPTLTLGPSRTVVHPEVTTITGSITSGRGEVAAITVYWDDDHADSTSWHPGDSPASNQAFTFDASRPTQIAFAARHTYSRPRHYHVVVTVADRAGGTVTQTIDETVLAHSSVVLGVTPALPVAGQQVSYTATVDAEGTVPTGGVWFTDGAVPVCRDVALTAAPPFTATCTTTYSLPGNHVIGARYLGDATTSIDDSTPLDVVVFKAPSEIVLSATPQTPTVGRPVAYTATITAAELLPTGIVTFADNGVTLCDRVHPSGRVAGTAVCTVTYQTSGTHTVVAGYAGDSGTTPAVSNRLTMQVQPASTAVTLTAPSQAWTFGDLITYTAVVDTAGQPATGLVSFLEGGSPLCPPTAPSLRSPHTASCRVPAAPGEHTVVARYLGDADTAGSASAPLTISTRKAPTTITATADRTFARLGQPVTVTVTVGSLPFDLAPSGSLTVMDGLTTLCSGLTLSAVRPHVATCSFAFMSTGVHRVFAYYSGDQFGSASAADSIVFNVDAASSNWTIKSSSANPSFGQRQWFVVTASPVQAGLPPLTGVVTFTVDGHQLGSPATLVGNRANSSSVLPTTPGKHTVMARYAGDKQYAAASVSLVQVVGCARTITGVEEGTFVVHTSLCASGAVLRGTVEVRPGGALALDNTVVNGPVNAARPTAVRVCGSHPSGPVVVSGSTGPVLIGGRAGSDCSPNRIDGAVTISDNTSSVTLAGNQIQGALTITGNTGGVTLAANAVFASLSCRVNRPAPTNAGQPNLVAGSAAGECAHLTRALPRGNPGRVRTQVVLAGLLPAGPAPVGNAPAGSAPQGSPPGRSLPPARTESGPSRPGSGSLVEASRAVITAPTYGQSPWQVLAMVLTAVMVGGVIFGLRRRPTQLRVR